MLQCEIVEMDLYLVFFLGHGCPRFRCQPALGLRLESRGYARRPAIQDAPGGNWSGPASSGTWWEITDKGRARAELVIAAERDREVMHENDTL